MRTFKRTDTKKLIVAFRNFANAPKNADTSMPPVRIGPMIPVFEQLERGRGLDRRATLIGDRVGGLIH